MCVFLKITSSHTPSQTVLAFACYIFFYFFKYIFTLHSCLLSVPSPCINLSTTPLWRVHVVLVNKNTIWIFLRPGPRRNIWRLICTLLIVDSDVLSEVTFISIAVTTAAEKDTYPIEVHLWSYSTWFISVSRVSLIQWHVSPLKDWPNRKWNSSDEPYQDCKWAPWFHLTVLLKQ